MSRVFIKLMPEPAVSQPKCIENLLETIGERVELHPVYQRDIRWSQENMCDLITSVMSNGFIPGILLYKLQPGDERVKDTYRTECIDGQHRFFTFMHFFNSKPVELPGKKPFLIHLPYKEGGRTVHVFYKKNDATEAWEAENRDKRADYMTEEEKDHFNSFLLDIREIRSPLSLEQRRQLFLSLQKGVPVRGSDLYKNFTNVPIVKFISEEKRWEATAKDIFLSHLSMDPKQYWLHWLVRCYRMSQAEDNDARIKCFKLKDSQIKEMIAKNHPLLSTTPESEAIFDLRIIRLFSFLTNLPPGVKVTPAQFYAIFIHLIDAEAGREDILSGHMRQWSTEGMTPKQRKMWENRGFPDEEREEWFERAIREIESIRAPAAEAGIRKSIPKKIRDRVWSKAFGDDEIGECVCCKDVIEITSWECAHIIAHKCGGKTEDDNLLPTCRSCNRSMGTENLEVFRARYYS
jgi:hypothetical protein